MVQLCFYVPETHVEIVKGKKLTIEDRDPTENAVDVTPAPGE